MTAREMEKILINDGWFYVSEAGSHRHYKHLVKPGKVTIPFHTRPKDLNIKTVNSIFKQAGLK